MKKIMLFIVMLSVCIITNVHAITDIRVTESNDLNIDTGILYACY